MHIVWLLVRIVGAIAGGAYLIFGLFIFALPVFRDHMEESLCIGCFLFVLMVPGWGLWFCWKVHSAGSNFNPNEFIRAELWERERR